MDTSTRILRRLAEQPSTTVWHTFYERYQGLIRGFARRLGLQSHDQSEILQETMIAASNNLQPAGMNGERVRAWLRTVSRRKIMDLLRQKYRRKLPEVLTDELVGADFWPNAQAAWAAEWQCELLERALAKLRRELPPKMYQAFDLYALREHEAEEVARILGINRALVYLYKLRVTERLRREVQKLAKHKPC